MQLDELPVEGSEGAVELGGEDGQRFVVAGDAVVVCGAADVVGGALRANHAPRKLLAQRRPLHGRFASRESL